eukprot:3064990-Pyramimonas_sp.AAC.1
MHRRQHRNGSRKSNRLYLHNNRTYPLQPRKTRDAANTPAEQPSQPNIRHPQGELVRRENKALQLWRESCCVVYLGIPSSLRQRKVRRLCAKPTPPPLPHCALMQVV